LTDESGTPIAGVACITNWMGVGGIPSDRNGNCTWVSDWPGQTVILSTFDPGNVYVNGYYSSSLPGRFGPTFSDATTLAVPEAGLTVTMVLPKLATATPS
jgi:hypothetical protein